MDGTKDIVEEEDIAKDEQQGVPDGQVLRVNPPHIDQVHHQDSVRIKDVPNNSSKNINPLTKVYLKKIL